MRRIAAPIILLLLCWGSAGCITLNKRSIDHDFGGLRGAMARSHIVSLLLVHGMGGYSAGDPDALVAGFQSQLHLRSNGPEVSVTVPDGVGALSGIVSRQDFSDDAGRTLRIYKLQWEPLSEPLKKEYLAYDDDPAVTKLRLPIHNQLKQSLMNTNVPDVVLYSGEYKTVLRHSVKWTLERMQKDLHNDSDYEFFFVTFSLGSKIVFDVVDEMDTEAERSSRDAIVDRTASFFMLANQIPLLGLGEVKPTSMPSTADGGPGYQSMLSFVQRKRSRMNPAQKTAQTQPSRSDLTIVAVSDPNDLFSYTIPPYVRDRSPSIFINVVMSVAKTGYWIPGEGYVASPLEAHTGYGHDPDVIKLIIDGGKANRKAP